MSEMMPDGEKLPVQESEAVALPRYPEELYDYFAQREKSCPQAYAGYADLAWEAIGAISEAVRYGKTDEEKSNEIALVPDRSAGIYSGEQTNASREFLEVLIIAYDLRPVADETTEYSPYGRILWQSSMGGAGINLIENRTYDKKGDLVRLTAVSHVPGDLYEHSHMVEELYVTNIFREESKAGIEAIPTVNIDEAAIVARYFSKAA